MVAGLVRGVSITPEGMETMSVTESPREEVLQIIQGHGPICMADIYDKCELVLDQKQLSNALYNLKKAGKITRGDSGLYSVAAGSAVIPPDATPPRKKQVARKAGKPAGAQQRRGDKSSAPGRSKPSAPAPLGTNSVLSVLLHAVEAAQAAIDEYVYAVGDASILDPLMTARNEARRAVAAYQRVLAEDPSQ